MPINPLALALLGPAMDVLGQITPADLHPEDYTRLPPPRNYTGKTRERNKKARKQSAKSRARNRRK